MITWTRTVRSVLELEETDVGDGLLEFSTESTSAATQTSAASRSARMSNKPS